MPRKAGISGIFNTVQRYSTSPLLFEYSIVTLSQRGDSLDWTVKVSDSCYWFKTLARRSHEKRAINGSESENKLRFSDLGSAGQNQAKDKRRRHSSAIAPLPMMNAAPGSVQSYAALWIIGGGWTESNCTLTAYMHRVAIRLDVNQEHFVS